MWYALQCNFTQAHKRITAFSEPIFMKLIHSEQQYGQISDTKLSQNWLRNVENTHKDSLTSFFRTAWLSLCRILLNLINALNLREEHLLYQISSKLENKCSKMGKVSCTPLRKVCLSWTVLHGSHNCSLTLFGDPPYRNSPISAQKYGKQRTNSITPLRKVWLSLRRFSWNSRVLENVCYSICIPILRCDIPVVYIIWCKGRSSRTQLNIECSIYWTYRLHVSALSLDHRQVSRGVPE